MDENSDQFEQVSLTDETINGLSSLGSNVEQITFGSEMGDVFKKAVEMCFDENGDVTGETSFILTEGDLEYSVGYRRGGMYHSTSPKRRYDTEGEILNGHVHSHKRPEDELTDTVADTEAFLSSSDLWNVLVTNIPMVVLDSKGNGVIAIPMGDRLTIDDKAVDRFNDTTRISLGGKDEALASQYDIIIMNLNVCEEYGVNLYRCSNYDSENPQFDLIVRDELLAVIRDNRSNS